MPVTPVITDVLAPRADGEQAFQGSHARQCILQLGDQFLTLLLRTFPLGDIPCDRQDDVNPFQLKNVRADLHEDLMSILRNKNLFEDRSLILRIDPEFVVKTLDQSGVFEIEARHGQKLCLAKTKQPAHCLVDFKEPTGSSVVSQFVKEHSIVQAIEQLAEFLFALPQGLLHPLALGDVA